MFGLFRTSSAGRKQQGITLLLVDMASPGLTVSPIRTFEGGEELNQVFFDDVRVPVADRLGDEHEGWAIGKHMLAMERFGSAEVSRTMAMFGRLGRHAADEPAGGGRLADDPGFASRMARAGIALRQLELTERRLLFGDGGPDAMGFESSLLKIRGTEVLQEVSGLLTETVGRLCPA